MTPCRQCGWPFLIGVDGLCAFCRELKETPDKLSEKKAVLYRGKRIPFHDMKQIDEKDRFKQIVGYLIQNPGKNILVMVDTGPGHEGKSDRYIAAIREKLPTVEIVSRKLGPVAGSESITFKLLVQVAG